MSATVSKDDIFSIASFLAQTRLLGALSFNELLILAANFSTYSCTMGDTIFNKGDEGDSLYLLKSGAVRIVLPLEGRKDTTLTIIYPGDLFGELAVLDGKPRSATAVAVEAVEAFTLEREHFLTFLRKQPDAAIRILGVLASRLRRTDELLGESISVDVPPRVAEKLLQLAKEVGVISEHGVELPLEPTRQDLAVSVGIDVSALNHYLRILAAQGIIQLDRVKATILEPDALEQIAK